MNIDNGHLIDIAKYFNMPTEQNKEQDIEGELKAFDIKDLGYTEVPKELETTAKKKLAGKGEAFVSLNSGGKLSKWAAKQRKDKKKMAKQSRRENR